MHWIFRPLCMCMTNARIFHNTSREIKKSTFEWTETKNEKYNINLRDSIKMLLTKNSEQQWKSFLSSSLHLYMPNVSVSNCNCHENIHIIYTAQKHILFMYIQHTAHTRISCNLVLWSVFWLICLWMFNNTLIARFSQ